MDVNFFLKIVIPSLLYSTLASLTIAAIGGGIIGAIVDFRRRRKHRSNNLPPPPRLIFLAILGSFMGTMFIGFAPILANPSILTSGLYLSIGLFILFITLIPIGAILGALCGCWVGDTARNRVNSRNIAILLGTIYLIMGIAIYRANTPAKLSFHPFRDRSQIQTKSANYRSMEEDQTSSRSPIKSIG
jgi:hypothetical protein